jgi:uncharacterized protein YfcZ (UPF0381/DUF406 family)|tara:strand:+ start:238 stop:1155 length:918 start_codon:yes stop_codon:yes gene_type:complete
MVDLQTAMAAASAERKQRSGAASEERKVRRSGASLGLEPFDPVKHVSKEKADTASMWLVIVFSITVSVMMRYVLMPNTTPEKSDILYLMPLSAIILIPQIHRMVMPKDFQEFYGKGTWFKAGFLHTFTFLAMSFLLVNPPMGDIVAPKLASHWAIATDNGEVLMFNEDSSKDGEIEWIVSNDGRLEGDIWLLFALADNVNSDGAEVTVELTHQSVTQELASDADFWATNSDRIANGTKTDNSSAPNLVPHSKDQPFAVNIGNDLAVGTHEIMVTITEDGDPWENERVYNWKLVVVEAVEQAESGQ